MGERADGICPVFRGLGWWWVFAGENDGRRRKRREIVDCGGRSVCVVRVSGGGGIVRGEDRWMEGCHMEIEGLIESCDDTFWHALLKGGYGEAVCMY